MCHIQAADIVTCIDNRPTYRQSHIMPELGRLYTVESVRSIAGGYSVRLAELAPACWKGGVCTCGECGWDAGRFRRVYRPEDSKLAVFRAALKVPVGSNG